VKDLIAIGGEPLNAGSRFMAGHIAAADAPSVERLKAQGAIIIGKTTTSEFGCKAVGDSPLTGVTRNPWDLSKTPGGSSAGAAASVAAGITPFAVGTDGGGSLRIPAALTGLVGFKAQFGRIPVWPSAAAPTLAHVGPIARNVGDAALLASAMAGYDARDPYALAGPVPDFMGAAAASINGLRIAWSPTLGYARPDPEASAIACAAAMALADQGASVHGVESVFERDPADIWAAEFYGAIGTRLSLILESRRELLDPAVADRLDAALKQDVKSYFSRIFERLALHESMRKFFEYYDVLLTPTLPVSSLDAGRNAPEAFLDRGPIAWAFYTYPFNLTGQPAASVCAGIASDGMPVGLQIIGRAHAEADVIRVAAAVERAQPVGYNLIPSAMREPRDPYARDF
jgi:aspartyl-tRNA(Asn)/glutamyl-tRNA(Gln) amidotransferase subunit A